MAQGSFIVDGRRVTEAISFFRLIGPQWAGHVVRAPEEREIYKVLYGRAMERRPQGRPRMRWVDNVRQDATSLGVRD